jgi:plastocyanin
MNVPRPAGNPPAATPDAPGEPPAAPKATQNSWLKYDAATNTVTFELIGGVFSFNGYTSGGATLVVPPKANVVMSFINKDGTPHSAQIISGEGPLPNAAVDAAIPRAYTNKVLEGLPQEAGDVMRFTVPESGNYRIFCGVPGHGVSGMWIWMKVDPAAKTPSFGPTKA